MRPMPWDGDGQAAPTACVHLSREILAALDQAEIVIASATFEVVGIPPLRLERAPRANGRG